MDEPTYRPRPGTERIDAPTSGYESHDGLDMPALPVQSYDPRSFAARSGHRPDLFVETALDDEPADPYNLTSPPTSARPRKGSVPDRSPLQSLELKLGDISKEEKRARIEEAEDLARRRSLKQQGKEATGMPGDWTSARASSRDVQQKQPNKREAAVDRPLQSKIRTNGQANNTTSGSRAVSGPTTGSYGNNDAGFESSNGPPGTYAPGSRIRSYGWDVSRSRDPAAAAVGAYQSFRRRQYDPSSPTSPTAVDGDSSFAAQTVNGALSRQLSSNQHANSQGDRGARGGGMTKHPQLQQARIGSENSRDIASSNRQPDPLPAQAVKSTDPNGVPNLLPPQTAGGQQAREQVGFGKVDPNQAALESDQGTQQRHLRDMLHLNKSGRRFIPSKSLDEWRQGQVARLTAEDLDLPSGEEYQPWWDKSAKSQGNVAPQNQGPKSGVKFADYDKAAQIDDPTPFQPALHLKCGPLLRYTGTRTDSGSTKKFWRGSVMIVTEDGKSSYQTPPVLRMFKQPMTLLSAPATNQDPNRDDDTHRNSNDLTANLPKLSRTGEAIYVKPIRIIEPGKDLSQLEDGTGLFEREPSSIYDHSALTRLQKNDGEKANRSREVQGCRLHAERGVTFWRFSIEVELTNEQGRIAYRINNGAPVGFWVPASNQSMNVMFHSCNGFSMTVDSNQFSGPDPMWRDVLSSHQIRPFHCMIGGGDQVYNDRAMRDTKHFQEWLSLKNPSHKHGAEFTEEMQNELEQFYLDRYSLWFSQGLFGLANSQIPMVNIYDDHDIIDGYGSYPHHFMSSPVFTGIGAIAFKYYMLFQHQSVPDETQETEPSWILGASPGPYMNQLSRSVFVNLGKDVSLLALDCRTERTREEVLSQATYDLVFDRCRDEIVEGETKHLIVLLGVPIAYPRLNFLENVLTSRAMDPIKALGRTGLLGGFVNKFDGGVEILDDLDDHWTAKHHKHERNWFIQELQELAAEKSVRITILGGDVHLAAVGQFYSNPKLGLPKDRDHRYMPNVISSAIVNTPPPEVMGDILNKRNKVHHLDADTDEDMIPLFPHDVDGKKRNNTHLLPRRNWCSIRQYERGSTPPPSPPPAEEPPKRRRSFSLSRSNSQTRRDSGKPGLLRRFSSKNAPPSSYVDPANDQNRHSFASSGNGQGGDGAVSSRPSEDLDRRGRPASQGEENFQRKPSLLTKRRAQKDLTGREGRIDLEGGLEIVLNCEIDQHDPAGFTEPYRLIVPALFYQGANDPNIAQPKGGLTGFFGSLRGKKSQTQEHVAAPVASSHEGDGDRRPAPAVIMNGNSPQQPPNGGIRNLSGGDYQNSLNEQWATPSETPVGNRPPKDLATSRDQPEAIAKQAQADPYHADVQRGATMDLPPPPAQGIPGGDAASDPARQGRSTASGPPPPSNLDQLPASVQKRYSQLNEPKASDAAQQTRSQSQRSSRDYGSDGTQSRQRFSQMSDPAAHKRYSQYEPLSSPAQDQFRRYSKGAMEFPLLPTSANQLRSSHHRTIQAAELEAGDRRSVSGPAAPPSSATFVNSLPVASSSSPYDPPQGQEFTQSSHRRSSSQQTRGPGTYDGAAGSAGVNAVNMPARANTYHAPPSAHVRNQSRAMDGPLPSPLASHAPDRDPYTTYDDSPDITGPGLDYDLESRGARVRQGRQDKLTRHYGVLDNDDQYAQRRSGGQKRSSNGLAGIVRRFSEGGGGGGGGNYDDRDGEKKGWKFWK